MNEQTENPATELLKEIGKNSRAAVISGIVLVIAGFLAIGSPFVAGLSITVMVGAMLTIGGIGQCFLAFKTGAFGKGLLVFVLGVLMAMVGIFMMQQPVAGLAKLTLFLMAYLIASGALETVVAFQLRPAAGWKIELFNGIVTLILGIMLWRQFPLSGAWALGVLLGIKMMFSGWAMILIGRSAKALLSTPEAA